jgi:hypothetical protein
VLVLTDTRLLLATIEADEPIPTVSAAPVAAMLRIELGEILLYAWLEWSWAADGELRQERVYFNSVRADLFSKVVETVRADIVGQSGPPLVGQERDLASFKSLPFKFANIIPHFLLFRGEYAEGVVFQPAIWGRHLGLLPYKRAPVTVAVLTPQHLLFVQDDLSHQKAAYGVIASYCPRNRVAALELDRKENEVVLNATLRWQEAEERLSYLFEAEAEPGLRTLIAKLGGSTSVVKMAGPDADEGSSNGRAETSAAEDGAETERRGLGLPQKESAPGSCQPD